MFDAYRYLYIAFQKNNDTYEGVNYFGRWKFGRKTTIIFTLFPSVSWVKSRNILNNGACF